MFWGFLRTTFITRKPELWKPYNPFFDSRMGSVYIGKLNKRGMNSLVNFQPSKIYENKESVAVMPWGMIFKGGQKCSVAGRNNRCKFFSTEVPNLNEIKFNELLKKIDIFGKDLSR